MEQFPPPSLIEKREETNISSPIPMSASSDAYAAAVAAPIINLSVVAGLCRRGAPDNFRAVMWKLLIGFLPPDTSRWEEYRAVRVQEYREMVRIVCLLDEKGDVVAGDPRYRAVDVDIPRTLPCMHFYNTLETCTNNNGVPTTFSSTQQSLRRIIHTLVGVNKGLGYVQGMNELIGHLLYAFAYGNKEAVNDITECEVLFCFQNLLTYLGDDFCRSLDFDQYTGVMCTIRNFDRLFQFLDSELLVHLEDNQVKSEFYAFRWITLLFTQEFNVPDVLRVWDFLLSFGEEVRGVVLYVAVAMLHYQREQLLQMSSLSKILPLLQSYPPCDVDEVLRISLQWIERYGFKLIKQLKVATSSDVLKLQDRYKISGAENSLWGSSLRAWVSSVKYLTGQTR